MCLYILSGRQWENKRAKVWGHTLSLFLIGHVTWVLIHTQACMQYILCTDFQLILWPSGNKCQVAVVHPTMYTFDTTIKCIFSILSHEWTLEIVWTKCGIGTEYFWPLRGSSSSFSVGMRYQTVAHPAHTQHRQTTRLALICSYVCAHICP